MGVDLEEANKQDTTAIKMLDVIPELENKYFDQYNIFNVADLQYYSN